MACCLVVTEHSWQHAAVGGGKHRWWVFQQCVGVLVELLEGVRAAGV